MTMTIFEPTRAAGLARLQRFIPLAGRNYAALRNYDAGMGYHEAVSGLSPYLRARLISEEDVLGAILERHSAKDAQKFVEEVFWRAYWKGWLEMRPQVWRTYQRYVMRALDEIQTQSGLRSAWEDACHGRTGIECFDAWARELVETGYLHNHARMWFASIWIFTLRLPWELGADFFLRHLLDGDPASNTLGWRWVAGLHTSGKHYVARAENIAKFTRGRFDPAGELNEAAVAQSGPPNPERGALVLNTEIAALPDRLRVGVVLHDEDMSPAHVVERVSRAGMVVASTTLNGRNGLSPLSVSERVLSFSNEGLREVATRHESDLGTLTASSGVDALRDWAKTNDLERIVTSHAPQGPVRDMLDAVSRDLDIGVDHVARPYDVAAWPHATHGFFRFRKAIPDLLGRMGLPS